MLDTLDCEQSWRWAAFGKHPAAKDYFLLGESTPTFESLFAWVEDGYQRFTAQGTAVPEFCSWRFWAQDAGKDTIVCGVVRVSSDSFGRTYPLVITGQGSLDGWQDNWDLLPFACEKTWCQIEYLAANLFPDLQKLGEEIQTIRPPVPQWLELRRQRKALNELGSHNDPYASFLDLRELRKLAESCADKGEIMVSLDRGSSNDKIIRVSLWHVLFKDAAAGIPSSVFIGGTLEKGYLALFRRVLQSADFLSLWSTLGVSVGRTVLGTEFSLDLSELGWLPVSAEKPAGSDVRYDAAFDALQTEVDKLSSPALAGSVNWEKVCRSAADILMHKSKDVLVAGYLAVAVLHIRGADGFAMGVRMYRTLLETFWDELYPPKIRMRGRTRSVEWWVEKTESALKCCDTLSFPPEQLLHVKADLNKLEIFLVEHLKDSPSLAIIKDHCASTSCNEVLLDEVASVAADAVSRDNSAQLLSALPPSTNSLTNHQDISSGKEAEEVLSNSLGRIRDTAYYLYQCDLATSSAYRLLRMATWYGIGELPPAINGRTRIPPPTAHEKNMLFDLKNSCTPEVLVKAAEARLPQYIFWLDLNRLSVEALTRLGSRYENAKAAVCQETALLIHRVPGLPELSFADGTPFATPETRQWLAGIAFTTGTAVIPGSRESESGGDSSWQEAIACHIEAIQLLLHNSKVLEAMEAAECQLRHCSSQRERFLLRLVLARMLFESGKPKLALPHLEQVLCDIDRFALVEFEPALAMRGLQLAWHIMAGQVEQKLRDVARDVLHRIGRMDMGEMVRLQAEG
jgi:type VI secretion system protein VasJ